MKRLLLAVGIFGIILFLPRVAVARSLVQGPGGRSYQVLEFESSCGEGLSAYVQVRPDDARPHSILIESFDPVSGETRFLLPPGAGVSGVDDRSPGLEIDPFDGGMYLIWSRRSSSDSELLLSRFNGDTWGEPVALTQDPVDNRDPSFIQDGTGRFHIVWWEEVDRGVIRYANFYPQDPWLAGALSVSSVDVLAEIEVPSGGGTSNNSFESRFPFLAYDIRTDYLYLAYESPADSCITVLRFSASSSLDNPSGGGQPIVPIKINLLSTGEEGTVAALPTVFTYRETLVVFWREGAETVGFVTVDHVGRVTPIIRLSVPEAATRDQVQAIVIEEVAEMLQGKQGHYPNERAPSGSLRLR